jgi:hypothetical protein
MQIELHFGFRGGNAGQRYPVATLEGLHKPFFVGFRCQTPIGELCPDGMVIAKRQV